MRSNTLNTLVGWFGLVLWLAGCQGQQATDTEVTSSALIAVCADANAPGDSWTCPAPATIECSEQLEFPIAVASPTGQACNADGLRIAEDPLTPGVHNVAVQSASGTTLCTTELTVTDHAP